METFWKDEDCASEVDSYLYDIWFEEDEADSICISEFSQTSTKACGGRLT
jgi:hypothetical protein